MDPAAPTPLYPQDTWKLVPLAAECAGCGSQTHPHGREGKSKNVKSSLKKYGSRGSVNEKSLQEAC